MQARRASSADTAAICRVCADGVRDTYPGLWTPEEIERSIEVFYNEPRIAREIEAATETRGWWVAEDDSGEVVGAAYGAITQGRAWLYAIYVGPDRRGEGAGTALLDAVSREQARQGALDQWVSVTEGNAKGIPFYEKHGFVLRERVADLPAVHGARESLHLSRPLRVPR